jgi:hypothetical protein
MDALTKSWTKEANKQLKGKTIESVRYMTEDEMNEMMCYKRGVVIQFTDGTLAFPMADDEGNETGVIFGQTPKGKEFTLPSLT